MMLQNLLFFGGLTLGGIILLRQVWLHFKPPADVVGMTMSEEWQSHASYQMTKPGGAQEPYLTVEERYL